MLPVSIHLLDLPYLFRLQLLANADMMYIFCCRVYSSSHSLLIPMSLMNRTHRSNDPVCFLQVPSDIPAVESRIEKVSVFTSWSLAEGWRFENSSASVWGEGF